MSHERNRKIFFEHVDAEVKKARQSNKEWCAVANLGLVLKNMGGAHVTGYSTLEALLSSRPDIQVNRVTPGNQLMYRTVFYSPSHLNIDRESNNNRGSTTETRKQCPETN